MSFESHMPKSTDNHNQSPDGRDASASFLSELLHDVHEGVLSAIGTRSAFERPRAAGTETFKLAEAPKSHLPEASLTDDYFDFSRQVAA